MYWTENTSTPVFQPCCLVPAQGSASRRPFAVAAVPGKQSRPSRTNSILFSDALDPAAFRKAQKILRRKSYAEKIWPLVLYESPAVGRPAAATQSFGTKKPDHVVRHDYRQRFRSQRKKSVRRRGESRGVSQVSVISQHWRIEDSAQICNSRL